MRKCEPLPLSTTTNQWIPWQPLSFAYVQLRDIVAADIVDIVVVGIVVAGIVVVD